MKRLTSLFYILLLIWLLPVSAFANETDYAPLVDSVANEMIGKTVPGACVVISEGGRIVFSKGYGFADVEQAIPMLPEETVFNLCIFKLGRGIGGSDCWNNPGEESAGAPAFGISFTGIGCRTAWFYDCCIVRLIRIQKEIAEK